VKKGPWFEARTVDYLRAAFGESVERRVMGGANDRGDVAWLYWRGEPFVIEAKNRAKVELASWMDEMADECGNADADMGAVVFHRKGRGAKSMGDQYVLMDLRTLVRLLGGEPDGGV
jgi:hypothetical protein